MENRIIDKPILETKINKSLMKLYKLTGNASKNCTFSQS
jgi:hypothetical protein